MLTNDLDLSGALPSNGPVLYGALTDASGDVPFVCARCSDPIRDLHLLKADNRFWHEDCLRCECCDCRLGEVGSSLYTKANLMLCKRDYLR